MDSINTKDIAQSTQRRTRLLIPLLDDETTRSRTGLCQLNGPS